MLTSHFYKRNIFPATFFGGQRRRKRRRRRTGSGPASGGSDEDEDDEGGVKQEVSLCAWNLNRLLWNNSWRERESVCPSVCVCVCALVIMTFWGQHCVYSHIMGTSCVTGTPSKMSTGAILKLPTGFFPTHDDGNIVSSHWDEFVCVSRVKDGKVSGSTSPELFLQQKKQNLCFFFIVTLSQTWICCSAAQTS